MTPYSQAKSRNKILFVNGFSKAQYEALPRLSQILGREIVPVLLFDLKKVAKPFVAEIKDLILLRVDFGDGEQIQEALKPYAEEIITATCLSDINVPHLKRVIPYLPHCILPIEKSLEWTTEKTKMRAKLRSYDKSIAPKFLVVHDDTKETIDKIEKAVGYPLVMKPSGLAASLLVSICYHREELEKVLKQTVKKIDQLYKLKNGRGEPKILVEEFMEGDMYSIDAYVNPYGVIYFAPTVYVKTGRDVGFDDFFGYMRMTPTQLNDTHTQDARDAAEKAIKALSMRSTTCHIELMRTEGGWKVIELGPRIGGFRHEMYQHSYGMDHSLNDLLIRIPRKPIIPKKAKGYTALLQFYAHKEGKLQRIQGVMKIQALASLKRLTVKKEPGDRCTFAKNGGDPVLEILLFNPIRSNVLADIRRIEQSLKIITEK